MLDKASAQAKHLFKNIASSQQGETAELISKGIISLILKSSGALLGLITFIYFSRNMESNDYGVYVTIFSISTFMSYVIASGGHLSSLRRDFVSKGRRSNNIYITSLFTISVIAFIILTFVLCALNAIMNDGILLISYTYYACFLAIGLALVEIQSALLRSYKEVISSLGAKDILWRLLSIFIFWILSIYIHNIVGILAYIVTVIALYIVIALQFLYFKFKYEFSLSVRIRHAITLYKSNFWLSAAAISNNLLPQLSVIAVSIILSYSIAGAFFSSQRIVLILALPIVSANIIGAPLISAAWRKYNRNSVQKICNIISFSSFVITLLGIIGIVLFGKTMLSVFNSEYDSFFHVLLILSLGAAINAFSGPTGYLMLMTGHERTFVLMLVVTQSLGLAAVVIGSTLANAAGAAIGEVLGAIAWNACVIVWSRKTLGIDPSILGALKAPKFVGA